MPHVTTFERLQELSDSQFHSLCDSLLSSLEPRYRTITPFGRNVRGQSVRGQPDSYVGLSPAESKIAFQYSTQKVGWQQKAIDDLRKAKQSCLKATEFVFATPIDLDRAKHKDGQPDWLTCAKVAVGDSELSLFGGRLIAQILDEQRQDIRYSYLGIPCSRLSAEAILARCQKVNAEGIARLIEQKRYSPNEYVIRVADNYLLQLWNRCMDSSERLDPYRMIPLVGDSGIGKTSLVARFVEAISKSWPILFIQARDVGFTSADSLVRHAVQLIEGVLSEEVRRTEEFAVAHAFNSNGHFTIVLDGLDEATDPIAVRQAITFWLSSSLGERSTLITTSRPEFWQRCIEQSWRKHIITLASVERLTPKRPQELAQIETEHQYSLSIFLPFSDQEMHQAGRRAGFDGDPFAGLDERIHTELRHPFTFHVAIQLLRAGFPVSRLRTRTDLINIWIDERLKAEVSRSSSHRLDPEVLRQTLVGLSQRTRTSNGGWLSVDDLVGLPRFDAARPPGPAVEALLTAGLLESRQPSGAAVRFAFEAVQDFFVAESDALRLNEGNLCTLAHEFDSRSFTETEWQLERMGRHLGLHLLRDRFALELLERDVFKAAALVRGAPEFFASDTLSRVVVALCDNLKRPIRVRRSKAAEMLRWLNCPAVNLLFPTSLLEPEQYSEAEIVVLAETILRLSMLNCATLILKCRWFTQGQFFDDIRNMFQNASPEFQSDLSEFVLCDIKQAKRGSDEYSALVSVLAYLGDERLVPQIARHFEDSEDLHWYEVGALIELGTYDSAELYFRFVSVLAACGKTTHELCNSKDDRRIWSASCIELRGRRKTLSLDFEDGVVAIIDRNNDVERSIARMLIDRFPSPRLLRLLFDRTKSGPLRQSVLALKGEVLGHALDFEGWHQFWTDYESSEVRVLLIYAAQYVRDARLELILRQSLENEDLHDAAATALAKIGFYRACPEIRLSLANAIAEPKDKWHLETGPQYLVYALGCLRDPAAVELLSRVARSNSFSAIPAMGALGDIRTIESGQALIKIATEDSGEHSVNALIHHGSLECVQFAVDLARQHTNGVQWLLKRGLSSTFFREWARGRIYRHIDTSPIIKFVKEHAAEINNHDLEKLFHWFQNVDGKPVRELLRCLATPGGGPLFPLADSTRWPKAAICALAERGDEFAVKVAAEQVMRDEWFGHSFHRRDLENFHSPSLVRELIECLEKATCSIELRRLVQQIGRHGTSCDLSAIDHFSQSDDIDLANVAAEAVARLSDPRLIPDKWP